MDAQDRLARGRRAAAIAAERLRRNRRVSLVDVGEKITDGRSTGDLAVRVHVVDKMAPFSEARVQAATGTDYIDKSAIPFDTVDIIEGAYPIELGPASAHFDPLIGGISTSNEYTYGYGTLGCGVIDRTNGRPMALSNWHVLVASLYLPATLRVHQPGRGDQLFSPQIGTVRRHALWNGFDAAVVELDTDRHYVNEQHDIGPLAGLRGPELGIRVMKSGRGSGVTTGVIDGVYGTYFAAVAGIPVLIREIVRIVPDTGAEVSRPGDSGSIWMDLSRTALGLHFAGGDFPETALAMDLPAVLAALDVELTTVAAPHLAESAYQPA